mmetsp:Transcript_11172/g.14457  ORF Transcript_11172/g.14457 Transcript_11172/m.14457 type:complete len:433 (-) Transcript_11172:792-2090(-)
MAMLPHDMKYNPNFDANKEAGPRESLTAQPSNGSTFQMNQPIEITVPMRQPEYVWDSKNSYVSFDITNNGATTLSFQAYCGTLGMVNQQIIKTSTGTEFSNFDGYNVLSPLLMEQVDKDWYNSTGNILFGMKHSDTATDASEGDSISGVGGTNVVHKILPLINTGVSNPYFPMGSLADIVIRFKLDATDTAFIGDTSVANTAVVISNIVYHYDIYKLSPSVLASFGPNYVIDTTDWVHQQYASPATDQKFSVSIGFAKQKVKRLIMVTRTTSHTGLVTNAGLMARNKAKMTKIYAKLDGKTFQSSSGVEMARTTNMVDAFAELLKNNGGLLEMSAKNNTLDRFNLLGAGTDPTTYETCGSFYHEISFSNSMDTDASTSGVAINHNNLQVFVEKAQTEAQTVDFFIEFYNQYTMNKNERVWQVADPVQYSQAQ